MKKKSKRSEAQYPALDPNLNLKTRRDQLEVDYLDKLPKTWTDPHSGKKWTNDQLKQYLNDFTNEAILADFKTNEKEGRKRIHKKIKVEHEKNAHLKKLLEELLLKIKDFVNLINESQINITSKIKLKKSTNKFKKTLRTQIKGEFKYIKDYYKKLAEDSNNKRNSCIYTKVKAQDKIKSMEDLTILQELQESPEDNIIDYIDNKREDE